MKNCKSSKQMIQPYRIVFVLFRLSAIFPMTFKCRGSCIQRISKCAASMVCISALIFQALTTIIYLTSYTLKDLSIAFAVMRATCIIYSWILSRRIRKLEKIARKLSRMEFNGTLLWTYFGLSFIGVMHSIILFCTFLHATSNRNSLGYSDLKRAYALKFFLGILYSSFMAVVILLPISTFAVFYFLVCQQMRSLIKDFTTRLSTATSLEFEELILAYTSLKSTTAGIDEELSLLVLCSAIYSSSVMYFSASLILHPAPFARFHYQVLVVCWFFNTLSSFIGMMVSAASVSEASSEFNDRVHCRLDGTQREYYCTKSDTSLSVWKIVPIKRNFIVGFIGTLFTYVILIDSLINR